MLRNFINQNLKNVKEEFKSFSLLTSIGFVNYINSSQILNSLYKLVNDNEMDILSSIISGIPVSNFSNLLYMKSFQDTSSSISLTRAIDELKLKLVVDDPKEVSAQTLDWYVTNLITCNGYVAHLQSTKYDDVKVHNAKISLISGIALGLGIPMLMLVEEPFEAPADYKDAIKIYTGKNECIKQFENWYKEYNGEITAEDKFQQHTQQEIRALSGLQNINLGENLAENEADRLLDYFVETICKMSFLGQEVKQDIFEFSYNEDQFRKYDAIARKNISRNNITDCRYKIHKAFHVELMIET